MQLYVTLLQVFAQGATAGSSSSAFGFRSERTKEGGAVEAVLQLAISLASLLDKPAVAPHGLSPSLPRDS
jgi:hypothetical protein